MINFLLKNPSLYRFYQKSVRAKYSEYDFFRFIFKQNNFKKIRMLDICCGDGHILEHVNEFISEYIGIDYNDKYLEQCRNRWKKFNFINLELKDNANIDRLIEFKPNFIFINGAIHHLDDKTVKLINSFIQIIGVIVEYENTIGECIKCKITINEIHEKDRYKAYPIPYSDTFYVIFKYDDIKQFINKWKLESLYTTDKPNFVNELNKIIRLKSKLKESFSIYFRSKREEQNSNKRCKPSSNNNNKITNIIYKTRVQNCYWILMIVGDLQYEISFRYTDISNFLQEYLKKNIKSSILSKTPIGKLERNKNPELFINKLKEIIEDDNYNIKFKTILHNLDYNTTRCK